MAKSKQAASDTRVVPIPEAGDGQPLTECRKCRSTRRGPYTVASVQDIDGKRHTWQRCTCTDCGQARIDRVVSEIPADELPPATPATDAPPAEPLYAQPRRGRGWGKPKQVPATTLAESERDDA